MGKMNKETRHAPHSCLIGPQVSSKVTNLIREGLARCCANEKTWRSAQTRHDFVVFFTSLKEQPANTGRGKGGHLLTEPPMVYLLSPSPLFLPGRASREPSQLANIGANSDTGISSSTWLSPDLTAFSALRVSFFQEYHWFLKFSFWKKKSFCKSDFLMKANCS